MSVRSQRGQGTIEFQIISVLVLIPLLMGVIQMGLLVVSKNTLNVATLGAARAGAASGGDKSAMQSALIATDDNGRIVLANAAAATLFGTSVGRMQGRALADFLVDLPGNGAPPPAQRAGRRFSDYAVTGRHANGSRIALAGSLSHGMHDDEGNY